MRIISMPIYSFEELSDKAKEKARNWWRECELEDSFWAEHVIYESKEVAGLMGIDIDNIYYTGFSSQGDGACFTGRYEFKKGSIQALKTYFGKDLGKEPIRIAKELFELQRFNNYELDCTVSHSGHYYHSGCTSITVSKHDRYDEVSIGDEDDLITLLRDFMSWIYRELESAYDFEMSDENVDENIIINDYEFREDGSIYR